MHKTWNPRDVYKRQGLDIVSFNVQNFVDDSAVIENLGVDNIVKIQKNAAISRAVSEKEIAKARAIAQKEANDAEVAAAQEIAEKKTCLLYTSCWPASVSYQNPAFQPETAHIPRYPS